MINAFICFTYLIGPFHAGPYLRSFFLSGVKRAGGKKAGVKGPKIHDFSPSSGVIFSSYFWDHSLITSSETGVWGEVEMLIYASALKSEAHYLLLCNSN